MVRGGIGVRLGAWRLEVLLGQGAFGETWRATDDQGRRAAVKLLQVPPGDELRALSRICHPTVIGILDAGSRPRPYLAMELAAGSPLDAVGPIDEARALSIGGALLDALEAVHAVGLTHGDVKPGNLVVRLDGDAPAVKLIDFGLAGQAQGCTPLWASPERLADRPASAAADIYAAGLVLWTLLHGVLPYGDLPADEALLKRRSATPEATAGRPWIRRLLAGLLAVDPDRRPTAGEAADVFAAHGVPLPVVDPAVLRRRARSIRVPRPIDGVVDTWLRDGGRLAIAGGPGTGRTHALRRAEVELGARGLSWIEIEAGGGPWAPVARALVDPRLSGPPSALPEAISVDDRAYQATCALVRRARGRLYVLVDDCADLDTGTRRALDLLAAVPSVHVLARCVEAPSWCPTVHHLGPWPRSDLREVVEQLLGSTPADLDALIDRIVADGATPGIAVETVVAAVGAGALVRRGRRWWVDPDALSDLSVTPGRDVSDLPPETLVVGAALACARSPMAPVDLAVVAGSPRVGVDEALAFLVERGIARVRGGTARIGTPADAEALRRKHGDCAPFHRRLAEAAAPRSSPQAWHWIGAGDGEALAPWVAQTLAEAIQQDPRAAAALAEAAWGLVPTAEVAAARIDALTRSGRPDAALAFGAGLDSPHTGITVSSALARAHLAAEAPDRARQAIDRARVLLGDTPPDLALLEVEARACFFGERFDDAEAIGRQARDRVPTTDQELDSWLGLVGIEAQSRQQRDDLPGAIARLQELPPDLGRGRASRSLLDAMLGRLLWHAGRPHRAARVMARAAAKEGGLAYADRARLSNNAALASFSTGDPQGAVQQWERAQLLLERLDAREGLIAVRNNLCLGYCEVGRWERGRAAGIWARDTAVALGHASYHAMAEGNLGDLYRATGQITQAEAQYARAVEIAQAHGLVAERVENLRRRAVLAIETGHRDAEAWCDEAIAAAVATQATEDEGYALAWSALGAARRGEVIEARRRLSDARDRLQQHGARAIASWCWCAAAVHLSLGCPDDAAVDLAKVRVFAEETGSELFRTMLAQLESELHPSLPNGEDILVELADASARNPDPEAMCRGITEAALRLSLGERAFLLQREPEQVIARAGDVGAAPSWGVARRAMGEAREIIVADLGDRPDLAASTTVFALDLRSVMCTPVIVGGRVVGGLYVDSRRTTEHELMQMGQYLRALAGYAGVALSNQQRLREAELRDEQARALVHDVRNLVQVLCGVAEEVTQLEPRPRVHDAMGDVTMVATHLMRISETFLDGEVQPVRPVCLAALTRELASVLRIETVRRGLDLDLHVSVDGLVLADGDQLRSALFNLLHNAFKHARRVVEVRLEVARGAVTWSCRDDGPGFPAVLLPTALFRGGVRGDDTGHGIGLATVAQIVHTAGGSVQAQNPEGGGGLVTLTFPRAPG